MYPLIRKMSKKGKNGTVLINSENTTAPSSFYELKAQLTNVKALPFSDFKGKKVIFVNTASDCGYTGQYSELQHQHHHSIA